MTIPLITTTVSPMPPGPQRLGAVSSSAFVAASDTWNTHVEDNLQPELAAVVGEINATAAAINTAATAIDAAAQTVDGLQNYKGAWASLAGALATPASVSHTGKVWVLAASVADVTAHTPGASVSWIDMTPPKVPVLPITVDSGNVTFATAPSSAVVRWAVSMGAQHELLFVGGSSSIHAVVWDKANKVFGAPVLVRSASWGAPGYGAAMAVSGTQAVLVTCPGTTELQAVCLTISGTSISVGTAATVTLSSALTTISDIELVGASVVIAYELSQGVYAIRALAVSGAVVSVGDEAALSGMTKGYLHAVSPSVVLAVSHYPALYAKPFSVSATVLTGGTEASVPAAGLLYTGVLSTGRWFAIYPNTTLHGCVMSVSGTAATISAVSLGMTASSPIAWPLSAGGRVLVASSGEGLNVLTDASGTAVAGTVTSIGALSGGRFDGSGITNLSAGIVYRYSVNGGEPSVSVVGSTPTGSSASPVWPTVKCTRTTTGVQSATHSLGGNMSSGLVVQLCKATDAVSFLIPPGAARDFRPSAGLASAAIAWSCVSAGLAAAATVYNLARLEIE